MDIEALPEEERDIAPIVLEEKDEPQPFCDEESSAEDVCVRGEDDDEEADFRGFSALEYSAEEAGGSGVGEGGSGVGHRVADSDDDDDDDDGDEEYRHSDESDDGDADDDDDGDEFAENDDPIPRQRASRPHVRRRGRDRSDGGGRGERRVGGSGEHCLGGRRGRCHSQAAPLHWHPRPVSASANVTCWLPSAVPVIGTAAVPDGGDD